MRLSCPVTASTVPAVGRAKGGKPGAVAAAAVGVATAGAAEGTGAVAAPVAKGDPAGADSRQSPASGDGPAAASVSEAGPLAASCTLSGSGLYFIDSIATDEGFTNPIHVPEGFVGSSIDVPPPTGGDYYLRLRDDPSVIDTVTLPAGPL